MIRSPESEHVPTMYALIRFIQKYYFAILFILLEIVCVVLLATSQAYHRQALFNATNNVVGGIYEIRSNINDYFSLGKQNKMLLEENARLHQQLTAYHDTTDTITRPVADTCYRYIAARVVNNTVSESKNYIVINKGSSDGIQPDMGVLSPDGVAGVVVNVSSHYAVVISLLHEYSTVNVQLADGENIANLKWETGNHHYGMLHDISTHVMLHRGDTVVTSSLSYIFPEGIPAAVVEEMIPSPSGDMNSAKVRFVTNFATLRNVYVIENTYKPEIDTLLKHTKAL